MDFYTHLVAIFIFLKTNLRCVVIFFCSKMVVNFSTWKIDLKSLLKRLQPKHELPIRNWGTIRNWSSLRIKSKTLVKELKCGKMHSGTVFNFTKMKTHLLAVVKFSVSNSLQFSFFKRWRPIKLCRKKSRHLSENRLHSAFATFTVVTTSWFDSDFITMTREKAD